MRAAAYALAGTATPASTPAPEVALVAGLLVSAMLVLLLLATWWPRDRAD